MAQTGIKFPIVLQAFQLCCTATDNGHHMYGLKIVNLNWLSLTVKLSCICHKFARDLHELECLIVLSSVQEHTRIDNYSSCINYDCLDDLSFEYWYIEFYQFQQKLSLKTDMWHTPVHVHDKASSTIIVMNNLDIKK